MNTRTPHDITAQWHTLADVDLPITSHIVNALVGLEMEEYRGASIAKSVGVKDLSDQRIPQ